MRSIQFGILIILSSIISILYIKQIFLSRDLDAEQRQLVDYQETASSSPTYENGWKQLALHIYQASGADPDLVAVLKKENVVIHTSPQAAPDPASGAPPSVPGVNPLPPPPAAP
jgi:hypothetical protein